MRTMTTTPIVDEELLLAQVEVRLLGYPEWTAHCQKEISGVLSELCAPAAPVGESSFKAFLRDAQTRLKARLQTLVPRGILQRTRVDVAFYEGSREVVFTCWCWPPYAGHHAHTTLTARWLLGG